MRTLGYAPLLFAMIARTRCKVFSPDASFWTIIIISRAINDNQKNDFFGESNEFQFKWLNLLSYDMKTPLPWFPGGQKALKLEKKPTFFNKINLLSENGRFRPFFISYFERGMFGRDIPQKISWGMGGGKFSTGLFKKNWKKSTPFFSIFLSFYPLNFSACPRFF